MEFAMANTSMSEKLSLRDIHNLFHSDGLSGKGSFVHYVMYSNFHILSLLANGLQTCKFDSDFFESSGTKWTLVIKSKDGHIMRSDKLDLLQFLAGTLYPYFKFPFIN